MKRETSGIFSFHWRLVAVCFLSGSSRSSIAVGAFSSGSLSSSLHHNPISKSKNSRQYFSRAQASAAVLRAPIRSFSCIFRFYALPRGGESSNDADGDADDQENSISGSDGSKNDESSSSSFFSSTPFNEYSDGQTLAAEFAEQIRFREQENVRQQQQQQQREPGREPTTEKPVGENDLEERIRNRKLFLTGQPGASGPPINTNQRLFDDRVFLPTEEDTENNSVQDRMFRRESNLVANAERNIVLLGLFTFALLAFYIYVGLSGDIANRVEPDTPTWMDMEIPIPGNNADLENIESARISGDVWL